MEVVYLAYSNSQEKPLATLKKEGRKVYNLFWRKGRDRNFIPFYEPFASVESLNETMRDCEGKISVFHFSGHAGSEALLLEDFQANPKGIGMQLRKSVDSKVLKLVVLNGCSTRNQVDYLLKLGVPVVIATHAAIGDSAACEFAISFFQSLCFEEKTIGDSFQDGLTAAQGFIKGRDLSGREVRTIGFLEDVEDDLPLWEIFSANAHAVNTKVIPRRDDKLFHFREKEKLLKTLFTAFYNSKSQQVLDIWKQGDKINKAIKGSLICNCIPRPIGTELEGLLRFETFVKNPTEVLRMQQLTQLFRRTNEFLAIVMIAQVWEIKLHCLDRGFDFNVPPELSVMLNDYLKLNSVQRTAYDFSKVVTGVIAYLKNDFEDTAASDFIKLQQVILDFSEIDMEEYAETCAELQRINSITLKGITEQEAIDLYEQAEDPLCDLFNQISFIHRYRLKSIHLIETLKRRYERKAVFRHSSFNLNQVLNEVADIDYPEYLDSHGVVIVLKEPDQKQPDFLNLSPFIVDFNSFEIRSTKSTILVFDQEADGEYQFRDCDDNIYDTGKMNDSGYHLAAKIHSEFNEFKKHFPE
ncbi:MAG: CHAT domain-containing protein [Chitinophagaceae bacterium]|nr:MAG: CHAT domain-containing protein [Chitinophagaceae bacterium]